MRTALHYTRSKYDFRPIYHSTDTANYIVDRRIHEFQFTEGLQFDFLIKQKINPYVFAEFSLRHLLTQDAYLNDDGTKSDSHDNTYTLLNRTVGFGLRYKYIEHFSVSIESILLAQLMQEHPISRLSINYHF